MKKIFSIACSLVLAFSIIFFSPEQLTAEGTTISFKQFLEDLLDDGEFDGQGATVKWEPNEQVTPIQRIQDENAQYQMNFANPSTDVVIKNANFESVPADIENQHDEWNGGSGSWTKDQVRNAEFQLLNTGNVTVENCNFEKVIVSPYGQNDRTNNDNRTFVVNNCTFSNVYNKYALKDIYPYSATITNNRFTNCSGAIYFEGGSVPSVERGNIVITNNVFDNIDKYCPQNKSNTRGIIQLSDDFNIVQGKTFFTFSNNQILTNTVNNSANTSNAGLPVIRLITTTGPLQINGWKAGEPLSVLINTAGASLPTLPTEPQEIDSVIYTFLGWLDQNTYQGAIADYPEGTQFLAGGYNQTSADATYYAVWKTEQTPEPTVDPTPTPTPTVTPESSQPDDDRSCDIKGDLNCDGVVTCDEAMGPGWVWSEEANACVLPTPVATEQPNVVGFQLVNTSDR